MGHPCHEICQGRDRNQGWTPAGIPLSYPLKKLLSDGITKLFHLLSVEDPTEKMGQGIAVRLWTVMFIITCSLNLRRIYLMKKLLSMLALGLLVSVSSYADNSMRFRTHLEGFNAAGAPIATNATGEAKVDVIDEGTAL